MAEIDNREMCAPAGKYIFCNQTRPLPLAPSKTIQAAENLVRSLPPHYREQIRIVDDSGKEVPAPQK